MQKEKELTLNKINKQILYTHIRLVDENGEQVGIMDRRDALNRAAVKDLDLILVSEKVDPPVCRLGDYGKWLYQEQKKQKEQRRKDRANQIDVKEIWLRPNIEEHDLATKAKQASNFIKKGNHVKIGVKFKGREQSHQEQGKSKIQDLVGRIDCETIKNLEQNGKLLFMVIGPKKERP